MNRIGDILKFLEKSSLDPKYSEMFEKLQKMHETGYQLEVIKAYMSEFFKLDAKRRYLDEQGQQQQHDLTDPKLFVPSFGTLGSKFLAMDGRMTVLVQRENGIYCIDLCGVEEDFLVSNDVNVKGACGCLGSGYLITYGGSKLIFADYESGQVINEVRYRGSLVFNPFDIQVVGYDKVTRSKYFGVGPNERCVFDIEVRHKENFIDVVRLEGLNVDAPKDVIALVGERVDNSCLVVGKYAIQRVFYYVCDAMFIIDSKAIINAEHLPGKVGQVVLFLDKDHTPYITMVNDLNTSYRCPTNVQSGPNTIYVRVSNIALDPFTNRLVYVCDGRLIFV